MNNESLGFLSNLESYINDLSNVGGKIKLISVFFFFFVIAFMLLAVVVIFFAMHWIAGLTVTILGIAYISYDILSSQFLNERRN